MDLRPSSFPIQAVMGAEDTREEEDGLLRMVMVDLLRDQWSSSRTSI